MVGVLVVGLEVRVVRYYVELEKGLWIAYGKGSSKTMFVMFARSFDTESAANRALERYRKNSKDAFENAKIYRK